jgi:hypothetical protein
MALLKTMRAKNKRNGKSPIRSAHQEIMREQTVEARRTRRMNTPNFLPESTFSSMFSSRRKKTLHIL